MVELQEHIGLQQLGLDGRGAHGDDRLPREDGRSLGYGPDIPGEVEIREIGEKVLGEDAAAAEIGNVLRIEVQVLNIVDDLLQPRRNGKAAAVGHIPVKHVKIGDAIPHPALPIAVAHGELIEIAEHGQIDPVGTLHENTPPQPPTGGDYFPSIISVRPAESKGIA